MITKTITLSEDDWENLRVALLWSHDLDTNTWARLDMEITKD